MTTNYEKYFGSPEKVIESISHSTCALDAALKESKVVACNQCKGWPGWSNRCFQTQLEWLQEECDES